MIWLLGVMILLLYSYSDAVLFVVKKYFSYISFHKELLSRTILSGRIYILQFFVRSILSGSMSKILWSASC